MTQRLMKDETASGPMAINITNQKDKHNSSKITTAPRLMVFFFINRLVSRGYLFRVVVLYLFILCLWKWKDWRLVFVFFSFLIRLVVPRGSLRIKIKKTLTACLHFSKFIYLVKRPGVDYFILFREGKIILWSPGIFHTR